MCTLWFVQGEQTMAHWPNPGCHLFLWKIFYWRMSIPLHSCIIYFALQWQRWMVTETMCREKPKILTIWTFSEKVYQSLVNIKVKLEFFAWSVVVSHGVPGSAHLTRADCVHLFSPMHLVMSCWQLEISYSWSIYTNKHHKSDLAVWTQSTLKIPTRFWNI